jgi:hypothetical protein
MDVGAPVVLCEFAMAFFTEVVAVQRGVDVDVLDLWVFVAVYGLFDPCIHGNHHFIELCAHGCQNFLRLNIDLRSYCVYHVCFIQGIAYLMPVLDAKIPVVTR